MISIEQITGEISALEEEKPTHVIMQKLANLYIVRDHMGIGRNQEQDIITATVREINPASLSSDTDFAKAIDGMDIREVLEVMDELMETLQTIQPRLYDGVMRKLNSM